MTSFFGIKVCVFCVFLERWQDGSAPNFFSGFKRKL